MQTQAFPRLTMFSQEQCETIHRASLEILRRTGVRVFHDEALDLLRQTDAVISDEQPGPGLPAGPGRVGAGPGAVAHRPLPPGQRRGRRPAGGPGGQFRHRLRLPQLSRSAHRRAPAASPPPT